MSAAKNTTQKGAEQTEKFNVLLSKSDVAALQNYIRTQSDKPYVTEAIRRIVRTWLADNGFH